MKGFTGKTGVIRHAAFLLGMGLILSSVAKGFTLVPNWLAVKAEKQVYR